MLLTQVLSNADLRAKYDAHGVEGLDVNFMDSAEFFSMLFGSDRFEHLLGELSLAQMTRCLLLCLSRSWFIKTANAVPFSYRILSLGLLSLTHGHSMVHSIVPCTCLNILWECQDDLA